MIKETGMISELMSERQRKTKDNTFRVKTFKELEYHFENLSNTFYGILDDRMAIRKAFEAARKITK